MKRHAIARMFGVMNLNPQVIIGCMEMISSGSYKKTFDAFLNAKSKESIYWVQAIKFYFLVAAYNPDTADKWTDAVTKKLCSGDVWVPERFCQGVTLGLLEAGVWFDEQGYQTSFQEKVLSGIAMIANKGLMNRERMPDAQWEVEHESFKSKLDYVVEKFLNPDPQYEPFRFGAQDDDKGLAPSAVNKQNTKFQRERFARQAMNKLDVTEDSLFWAREFLNALGRHLPRRDPVRRRSRVW